MFEQKDLRGIVTIVMLCIFFLSVFVPIFIQVAFDTIVEIPSSYTQAVISLTTVVVTFYFTNKATKDRMDEDTNMITKDDTNLNTDTIK